MTDSFLYTLATIALLTLGISRAAALPYAKGEVARILNTLAIIAVGFALTALLV